ncbi:MAG: antitoxin Xre/MbcA/ParS toxin-binding domain-containing protein [Kiritimatiellia bacterium]
MTNPAIKRIPGELSVYFADSWKDVGRKSLVSNWIVFNRPHSAQERLITTFANLSCRRELLKGLDQASIETVTDALLMGLSANTVDRASSLLGLNREALSRILDVSPSTLARRKVLKSSASDRLFRVSALFQMALEVFEDRVEARQWFTTPKRALGGKTPLEFSETEVGAREVEDLLGRIEYGVYA